MAHHPQQYMPATAPRPTQPAAYGMPMQGHAPAAPAGTFTPGTKIQVGAHRIVIQKYLSEGGFAHVYLVKLSKPENGTDVAVLKRVAVPDKEALRSMRTEVETMKRLKGHRPIVTYIDSHASELKNGGYEVFLLMEFCNGGGLIDFMNTRLQHRLTEPEILQIFTDIAEGVACMHYLKPALLHRDLKVENVLILTNGSRKRFKLCDFGSAAAPKPAPQSVVECRLMDEDVQRHTTMQYRSPEMVDVYRKQPIDEKSDIWALGVLLYKLCYYTTPFEDQGQLAILNASYRFHSHPVFSDKLKRLIASMLRENQGQRPNIYQVLREACAMQGREVPIHDIYSGRSQSEPRGHEKAPPTEKPKSTPVVGAVFSPPVQETQVIPEVKPMRRGRPPAAASGQPANPAQKPSPSPGPVTSGDPFAALDAKPSKAAAGDDISSRFPSLDQFSLLHNQSKFDFDTPTSPPMDSQAQQPSKLTEHLADDAFATKQPVASAETSGSERSSSLSSAAAAAARASKPIPSIRSPPPVDNHPNTAPAAKRPTEMSRASSIIASNPELRAISAQSTPKYVSTGTMTSTPPPPGGADKPVDQKPIWRVPSTDHQRSWSLSKQSEKSLPVRPRQEGPATGKLISQASSVNTTPFQSRPPSTTPLSMDSNRSGSTDQVTGGFAGRQRPASTHLESSMDFLRERQSARKSGTSPGAASPRVSGEFAPRNEEETNIESNVEFLRSMEQSGKKERESWHGKKPSITPTASGSKNSLVGKFGEAFKRFEGQQPPPPMRTPSPRKDQDRPDLTPIAGSEATDGRSDDGAAQDGEQEMTAEMRRDIERNRLAEEERRVEAARAEYRQRKANEGPNAGRPVPPPKPSGGSSRAVNIQNRVQSLLDQSQKPAAQRTAQGYGAYSDAAHTASRLDKELPELPPKPTAHKSRPFAPTDQDVGANQLRHPKSEPVPATRPLPGSKPPAPRKPMHLNSNTNTGSNTPSGQAPVRSDVGLEQERLMASDLPGQPVLDMSSKDRDDYLENFSKRFPSLGHIEMVERDVDAEPGDRAAR